MANQNSRKKKKADYETDSVKLGRLVSRIFFYLIMIVVPCFYDSQAYLNMIGAKGGCALICTYIGIVGLVCFYFHGFLAGEYKPDITFKRWNAMDFLVILLSIGMMFACFTSANVSECLSGEKGFYNGALKLGLLALLYFFISRHVKAVKQIWNVVFIVVDVATFWLFLNFCSIDVFGLHAMILEEQFYAFSSCLGNVDSISAYYSIISTIIFVFFINEEDEKRKLPMFIHMCFAALGVLTVHSDGIMIGMFFFSILFVFYALSNQYRLTRTFLILAVVGVEMTIIQLMHVVLPEKIYYTDELTNQLMGKWVGIPVMLVFGLLYFFANKSYKANKAWAPKLLNVLAYIYAIITTVGFTGVCAYIWKTLEPGFGTGRGGIWLGAWEFFKSFSLKEKIFGVGPHMLRDRMTDYCAAAGADGSLAYATCHNGILEVLTTLGIFGLTCTVILWIVMVALYLKNYKKWEVEPIAYVIAAFAYLGQSFVGNPYSMTVPMFIVVIMLYRDRLFEMRVEELKALEAGDEAGLTKTESKDSNKAKESKNDSKSKSDKNSNAKSAESKSAKNSNSKPSKKQ
ncbi:MAG: hypothetical protein K5656_05625 [Lachnospiraceae bacterium]|nr:hypothetical protein [Lachnospiraceae bacterium]